jgi:hypothetical protein
MRSNFVHVPSLALRIQPSSKWTPGLGFPEPHHGVSNGSAVIAAASARANTSPLWFTAAVSLAMLGSSAGKLTCRRGVKDQNTSNIMAKKAAKSKQKKSTAKKPAAKKSASKKK